MCTYIVNNMINCGFLNRFILPSFIKYDRTKPNYYQGSISAALNYNLTNCVLLETYQNQQGNFVPNKPFPQAGFGRSLPITGIHNWYRRGYYRQVSSWSPSFNSSLSSVFFLSSFKVILGNHFSPQYLNRTGFFFRNPIDSPNIINFILKELPK